MHPRNFRKWANCLQVGPKAVVNPMPTRVGKIRGCRPPARGLGEEIKKVGA